MLNTSRIIAFAGTAQPERARDFHWNVLGLRLLADEASALVFDAHGTQAAWFRDPDGNNLSLTQFP